ncbi:MAG: putative adenylyl-sulfate kinase [Alphaproteobacteria bacterium MarineAlpha5_Bin11]|nr:adenylylsulfate kinase [Pelagibacteraceae bacterium]PPR44945.1 MAG: putative adenylyl-sulfate kinase [Alphaproteobacteria bacterium MarineAlpha5_Bin11]PPR51291.1 MAG: putative adenylyl-sulfate kinase [Alphaproteobacteria bacterium MarineAlpha5_Bin10]|tara:strand:- start:29935 stop:30468 length:534 start_codon:yes stop_codon:yes gene_type:complete
MVIWLTGLSGSGKTTIANSFLKKIKSYKIKFILIDGDIIRNLFSKELSFQKKDRIKQIQKIQLLSKFLSDQGFNVIVAALYSNKNLMKWNKKNLKDYVEVYVKAPLELLIKRDTKGLYADVINKKMKHMVGIDIKWIPPKNPHLTISQKIDSNPESCSLKIVNFLKTRKKYKTLFKK